MNSVATVLTVYGIETFLKKSVKICIRVKLQQYLPFTVLKPHAKKVWVKLNSSVATVLTVYGIETLILINTIVILILASCNSTYRLRY